MNCPNLLAWRPEAMARRKRSSKSKPAKFVLLAGLAVLVAGAAWLGFRYLSSIRNAERLNVVVETPADHIDPANEGRHVKVSGQLSAASSARDREFATGAKAAMLFRKVEMLQWQEHCAGADCAYEKVWSGSAIDSHKFHTPAGHDNPPLRIVSARFDAGDIHLGLFEVDPALIEAQLKTVDHAVRAIELPPNMAATFSEHNGLLYAGGDPEHPDVGTVRISYRAVPLGAVTLTGAQRGKHLTH
jgi:Transmembrane protein 43